MKNLKNTPIAQQQLLLFSLPLIPFCLSLSLYFKRNYTGKLFLFNNLLIFFLNLGATLNSGPVNNDFNLNIGVLGSIWFMAGNSNFWPGNLIFCGGYKGFLGGKFKFFVGKFKFFGGCQNFFGRGNSIFSTDIQSFLGGNIQNIRTWISSVPSNQQQNWRWSAKLFSLIC